MFNIILLFGKIVFFISITMLFLFKLITKEKKIFKNKNFLSLLFSIIFLFITYLLLPISANIILGGYKNTLLAFDRIGFFLFIITTSFAVLSPIILFYFFTKNFIFLFKYIKNNIFNKKN